MADYELTEICAFLRSKQMYAKSDPAHRAHSTTSLTEVFWCNFTMASVGPDERLCDSDRCCKGRWCWHDPLDPK